MRYSSMDNIRYILEALYLPVNKTNGFFIESGALDGQFLSNTLWLEQNFNWTGLLIEPDNLNYKDLREKNRKSWLSNSCISTELYPKKVFLRSMRRSSKAKMLSWFYRGSSLDKEIPLKYDIEFHGDFTYQESFCFPLYTYLLALNITQVDLITLDTQGGEDSMLYNFPWEKIDVTTVVIERITDEFNSFDKKLVNFMNSKGFIILATVGEPDYIFIKKNHELLKNIKFETLQDRLNGTTVLFDNITYNTMTVGLVKDRKINILKHESE